MENIQDKFKEIYNRDEPTGNIFLGHRGEVTEWLILGYMTRMLKLANENYPVYAEKTKPPEPDFITYDQEKNLFHPVEITEILHKNRKRGDEYKIIQENERKWNKLSLEEQEKVKKNLKIEIGGKLLGLTEWIPQITNALNDKYLKRYSPSTWLLIYFNIPYSHIAMNGWWHTTMEYIINDLFDKNKDLQKSPYSRILMTDCEGDAMIQVYPSIYTIKEAETKTLGTNRNLDIW